MFQLLSWNIDGLDGKNTVERARAVCSFIKTKLPHVVFLQEVVDSTWAEITKELNTNYDCFSSRSSARYYVVTLVRKDTVKTTGSVECLQFESSRMGRSLLQVPIRFADVEILLMNSHLESTDDAPCTQERRKQLKRAFDIMEATCKKQPEVSCVFAGDLNLLDGDVRKVGAISV